ncbi:MAG: ABC transporter ATP-binding protein [Bacteroidota bacterium]|nr:ABC transporter ATP-binding protein [Bacteroidota bacterium]MDP4232262.1 ABC transporter ATP-binding protein [Bacteroidota bacterium]MDP4242664.1 ABC transporter ATP-binding protein [Bacteroidota bacterium]MDP4286774.1 ABC transporter ATP-binding protein [Bacteroidota bacterium]
MIFRTYRRLLPLARPYRTKMIISSIFNILGNLMGSVSLLALLPIVSVVIGESQTLPSIGGGMGNRIIYRFSQIFLVSNPDHTFDAVASLFRICLFVFVTSALKNVFSYLSGYIMAIVENGMARSLRDSVFEKLSTLSLDYYYDRKSGHLLSRLTNDVAQVNSVLTTSIMTMVGQPVSIITILGTMLVINARMTLLSLAIGALSMYLVRLFRGMIKGMAHRLQNLQGDILSVAQEMISGVKVVKSFGMERYEVRRFKAETEKHFNGSRRLARIRGIGSPINEMLATLGFIGILWFGGHEVFAKTMPGGGLIFFLGALIQLMQPIKNLSELSTRLYEGSASAENLFAILDAEPSVKPGTVIAPKSIVEPIHFENVSFQYRATTENAIDGIDLEIFPNEILALVGPSGAGKTTFVDLLVRFYDPTSGRITLGGRDLRDYELESLRKLFGIVTQETLLFHDSIKNNIFYGNRDASEQMVHDAARAANAHEFIMQLPDGYNTMVGDRGVRLSGGQRQRIAIARALLKDPPILIFDEATSALDTENEMLVQEAIQNLLHHRTAVVIAHRLSTIQQADRIVVMDKGGIVEIGNHEKLLANEGGLYRRLYTMQSRAATDSPVSLSSLKDQ